MNAATSSLGRPTSPAVGPRSHRPDGARSSRLSSIESTSCARRWKSESCPVRLPAVLRGETGPRDLQRTPDANDPTITFTVPARLKRTGMETRLLIDGADGSSRRNPDYSLHRLLARAYRYNDMVMRSDGKTMTQLAAEAGVVRSYFTRILRLSFLAPEIVKAILRDRHPIELTAKRLANELRLPIAWDEQRALLGSS